jgi:hypothetical protein
MDHLFWHETYSYGPSLDELKEELKTIEKQINKAQWRGQKAPGNLLARRLSLRGEISKLEKR